MGRYLAYILRLGLGKMLDYRIRPKPRVAQEWWLPCNDTHVIQIACGSKELATKYYGTNLVHVREVLPPE